MINIIRLKDLPEGSGLLSNDDILVFMDDPSGSGTTKKITFGEISNLIGSGITNPITIVGGDYVSSNLIDNTYTISVTGLQPSGNYSLIGHNHSSNDITDFNSSVSGLIPVKNISAGSGIGISSSSGNFTVSVTGTFGLTSEEVDDRVSNLLVGSNYINLNYNDLANSLTISTTGLQPSGNYSIVGHNHISTDITDFNSAVSGLLPQPFDQSLNTTDNVKFNSLEVVHDILFDNGNTSISSEGPSISLFGQYYKLIWRGDVGSLGAKDNQGVLYRPIYCESPIEIGLPTAFPGAFNTRLDSGGIQFPDGTSQSTAAYVKDIVAGTGINVSSLSGIYTISSTGSGVLADQAASLVTTVFNKTGSPIPKMTAVYINGGQGDMPTISLAQASGELTSSKTYGLTAENISNMSSGKVIVFGSLTGLNTDQFNPTAPMGNVNGVTLYLSSTIPGGLTTTKPSAPNHMVAIGTIIRTHQNEGIIEVRVQNGFELEELHNVAISGVSDGQFLQYNSNNSLWIPSSSGNFSSLTVNNTGVSLVGHTHASTDISDFNNSVNNIINTSLSTDIVAGTGVSISYDNINDDLIIGLNGFVPVVSLGTLTGSNAINGGMNNAYQTLTLNGTATTLIKSAIGWPTTSSQTTETILKITVTSATTITWTIVTEWFNQPPAGALAIGTHLFLLRGVGTSVVEGHYIGNKTN